MLNIKGIYIYYKYPSLKNDIFIYRCRKSNCKYYIKINRINKIYNKENDVVFTEFNKHENHQIIEKNENISQSDNIIIRTEEEIKNLAETLKNNIINETLDFHSLNFKTNKIIWKKSKIKKLFYNIRERLYPKEEKF